MMRASSSFLKNLVTLLVAYLQPFSIPYAIPYVLLIATLSYKLHAFDSLNTVVRMGKGGKKEQIIEEKETLEVLMNGKLYDVTNLKHPGGNVIKFYANKGIDASAAFDNFHLRSEKARKYLDNLPSRDAVKVEKISPLMADFKKLTEELKAEGFFKPSIPHVIYRVLELVLLHAAGIWLIRNNSLPLGIVLLALGQGRSGWLMHEGGHYSLTGRWLYST